MVSVKEKGRKIKDARKGNLSNYQCLFHFDSLLKIDQNDLILLLKSMRLSKMLTHLTSLVHLSYTLNIVKNHVTAKTCKGQSASLFTFLNTK